VNHNVDLGSRSAIIAGLRGSGKTNLAKHIAGLDPDAVLIYDPMIQYAPGFDVIHPKQKAYPAAAEEFARILALEKLADSSSHPYRLLIVDEAARIAPNQKALNRDIAKFNAEHRHYPLGVVWIAQRPRQLHVEIVNLADYLFIFRLPGATDHTFLENTARGLAEAVESLEEFQYVFVDQRRSFYTIKPAPDLSPKT
jgi:DNA helicase HerA-like ATPase